MFIITLAIVLPVFLRKRPVCDSKDFEQCENIAAAREYLRVGEERPQENDNSGDIAEHKQETEDQLLSNTGDKPATLISAITKPDRIGALFVTFFLLLTVPLFYLWTGNPDSTLSPQARLEKQITNLQTAVEKLRHRIAENPQDIKALSLLAATMMSLHNFEEAARYYQRIREISGDTTQLLAANIRALMAAGAEVSPLVEHALKTMPEEPLILWLAGLHAHDNGELTIALSHWQHAQEQLSGEKKARIGAAIADLQKQIDKKKGK